MNGLKEIKAFFFVPLACKLELLTILMRSSLEIKTKEVKQNKVRCNFRLQK
jgi:hypothetical protein